jgi:tetratricopeptide (TPR) repeat protein
VSDPVERQLIRDLRRVLSVLPVLVCFVGLIPQARGDPQTAIEISVKELIGRYAAGDWSVLEAARPRLRNVQDLTRFRNDLRREARSSPPLVLAALALEAAAAAAFEARNTRQSEDRTVLSYLVLSILEIGCARLSGVNASGAFVLDWNLASLALLQGPVTLLWGGIESPAVFNASSVAEHGHPLHVRERFPRDPQIALRWGISQELYVHTWLLSFGVSWSRDTPEEVLLGRRRDPHMRFHRDTELRTAAVAFEEAAQQPSQKLEAMLRLGRVRSLLGEWTAALALLRSVAAQSEDSDRRYLAHLFIGRTLIERGDLANAIREFQSALSVKPGTQSAVAPLASLLYLDDQRSEVADLIDRLLEVPLIDHRDPWADYLAPGYRDWPRFINSVREGLRQ